MEEQKDSLETPLLQSVQPKKKPAYLDTNIFDAFLLFWVGKLTDIGKKKPFQQDMHYDLRKTESSHYIVKQLADKFEQVKHKKNPLVRSLLSVIAVMLTKAVIYALLSGLLKYTTPLLIKYTIDYVTDPDKDLKTGVLLLVATVSVRFLIAILSTHMNIIFTIVGIRTSNAINGLIYNKALKFSLVRSPDHSLGSLTNHIQVDSEKLSYLGQAIGASFTFPILILVGLYFMYDVVGVTFMYGIGVLVIMSFANFYIGKQYFVTQEIAMEKKDDRMRVTTEILNGIKYIKMSGWEEAFLQKIGRTRDIELKCLKKLFVAISFSIFTLWLTPILITIAIFAGFVFSGNAMDAVSAFTIVSTLAIIQEPLRTLPEIITLILESKVALDRVTKFLLAEEVQLDFLIKNDLSVSETAIRVRNGNFYWLTEEEKKSKNKTEEEAQDGKEKKDNKEKEGKNKKKDKDNDKKAKKVLDQIDTSSQQENSVMILSKNRQPATGMNRPKPQGSSENKTEYKLILQGINLEIKKGSFVAILGDVGSGKSSLLFSLIGEMKYDQENPPEVEINGSVSYVSQAPWILNDTVKGNVIFKREVDEAKYQAAIKYSCLQADLDILTKKDETEIGEKGVNMSGGQKARISLARALYRESDIYLLDDPLSAVDAHVGNFILKECFMGYLEGKTRVLVTHKFECLKHVDYIYIFSKGRIVEAGTFQELRDSPTFQEVEKKYKMIDKSEEQEPVEDLIEKENSEESTNNLQVKEMPVLKKRKESKKEVADKEEDKALQDKLMLDEDRVIGVVGWKVWKSYFDYYGGIFYFLLVFIVMLTWITLMTGSNFWLSYWSDHPERFSRDMYFEVYCVIGISSSLFCFARVIMLLLQSVRCSRMLHRDILVKIIRAPVNLFFDRVPIGRLLNRLSKDLAVLDSYISTSFGSTLVCLYCMLADIVVCLIVGSFWVFPLVIVFSFVAYKIQTSYMKINREVVRLESMSKSPIVSFLSESLNGLTSIRAYQEEEKFANKFHQLQDENIKNLILSCGLSNWFTLRITIYSLLVVGPSVGIPLLVNTGAALTAGAAGLLINYVVQISEDVISLLWMISYLESQLISLERCRALTQIEGEANPRTVDPASIENYSSSWPIKGSLEFRDYYVKYRPNLPHVVKDLNVYIEHGEKIGVVGRTGSGKSTLLLSLLRIIEADKGQILIDGVDTARLGLDDLRRKITIIPQDPMLFKGSLRDNLDLLKVYSDEELWRSLEMVCMKTKFEQENGLDTEIKEGGENLSAGEKQLLCIGRAILAQSKIILIDEATSNIDPNTEQTILDTLQNSFKACTVVTIAHRLKTVINSDKILVMGDGHLLEFATPKTLIDDETTHFHKLWKEYERAHKDHV